MPFTETIFSFGTSGMSGTSLPQQGFVANVPADGSAKAVLTFPTPYLNQATSLQVSVDSSAVPGYELSPQYDTLTKNGANIYVAGGPAGSHVTVSWQATGN